MRRWFSRRKEQIEIPLVFRVREWPQLPAEFFRADVLRAFSKLGRSPFSVEFFAASAQLAVCEAHALLAMLVNQGAVERVDPRVPSSAA